MSKSIKQILQNIKSEADKALANLERPVDRFVPKYGGLYYFVKDSGGISCNYNENLSEDRFRILTGNCYRTEEQAERAFEIINRIGELRGDWLPDWGDREQRKYHPVKDHRNDKWFIGWSNSTENGSTQTPTEQAAQTLIDEFGDDLLLVMRRL